jgi:hypothetical protein
MKKKQLDTVLLYYNLMATVHFPTRIQNQSNMAIDNIFIDTANSQSILSLLYTLHYEMMLNC